MNNDQKNTNNNAYVDNKNELSEYRYRTCYLKASIKKLLMTSRRLKNMTLIDALRFSALENKIYSKLIHKSIKCIMSNMINVRNVNAENIKQYILSKVIIEKKRRITGIRYRARGGYSITNTYLCRFNIYLKKEV